MTNPFTAFAFDASGAGVTTAIKLPDRLAYIKNVKDFGATGAGFPTDDWAAIMAAFNWTTNNDRGTIYFPPGTYYVSQPIDFSSAGNASVRWVGDLGASIVTGNFSDFIFKVQGNDALLSTFSKLTITNTNATGGGILAGSGTNMAFRDLVITANMCLSAPGSGAPNYQGFQDCTIENCTFSPGSNTTASFGLWQVANGPIINCSFNNFTVGMYLLGAEAAQSPVSGCFFQKCGTGIDIGVDPTSAGFSNNFAFIGGCWFKNNSVAINFSTAGSASWCTFAGLRIEGTNGQAPGGTDPQYGIIINTQKAGQCLFAGISITGQYAQAGIYIGGGTGTSQNNTLAGVQVSNSGAGVPWNLVAPEYDLFDACNVANVFTVAQIGTAGPEGSLYNVSDGTNSLAWGATLTNTGTHATHYKVRSNGTNWTVVGQ